MEDYIGPGQIAIASLANKPVNEDFCLKLTNENAGFNAVIIADGLGSNGYAANASQFVCNWMMNKLLQLDDVGSIDFLEFFPLLKHALIAHVEEFENENSLSLERYQNFGTTLICAVETEEEFIFAYVGNGAILHIKGNFNEFSPARIIPWNTVNYLSPHTIEQNGREALYKLVSPTDNFDEITPTIIKINKEKNYGDIIFICTDGIFSQDQVRVGKNTTGAWMKVENCLIEFYNSLNSYFVKEPLNGFNDEDPNNGPIKLENYLQQFLKDGEWDDDATLGLIISKEAIEYQNNKDKAAVGERKN